VDRRNNELKGGVSYDKIQYTDRQDYTGTDIPTKFGGDLTVPCTSADVDNSACYVLLDTRGGVVANLRQTATGALRFRTTRGRFSPNAGPTETDDYAIFLQDTLTFARNWTLKAGIRASQQEIRARAITRWISISMTGYVHPLSRSTPSRLA
jgi:outer membrane receptor protein involved in Fe transport